MVPSPEATKAPFGACRKEMGKLMGKLSDKWRDEVPRRGLFLSDLPSAEWIQYVRDLEKALDTIARTKRGPISLNAWDYEMVAREALGRHWQYDDPQEARERLQFKIDQA